MRFAVAAFAALTLVACNPNQQATEQSASTEAAPESGGMFPDLANAQYRAEGVMTRGTQSMQTVMVRDRGKLRMEFTGADGGQVMIRNPETQQTLMIASRGGRQMAMSVGADTIPDMTTAWRAQSENAARRTGDCTVAGETGAVWEYSEADGSSQRTACVTTDGIPLRLTDNGATIWETTRVQRGPQPAEQFVPPPGVQVMNLNAMGSDIAAKMREAQSGRLSGQGQ